MDTTNFKEYYNFLMYLETLIDLSVSKYGDIPPMYFYLYELTLYKIMEALDGDMELINFFRTNVITITKNLIQSYYSTEGSAGRENGSEDNEVPLTDADMEDRINRMNEEIKKAKEEIRKQEEFKVPNTFKEFMGDCKENGTVPDVEVPKDKSDKIIDDYLKKKKSKKTKTSRKKKK